MASEAKELPMTTLKLAALGALLIGLYGTASPNAFTNSPTHRTYITFDRAVALPGVQLPAGSYVFEAISAESPEVVVVRTRKDGKAIIMKPTRQIHRPAWNLGHVVSFGEAAPGAAAPIRAWFPEDATRGYEFIYN
jgi:hypothetical protein